MNRGLVRVVAVVAALAVAWYGLRHPAGDAPSGAPAGPAPAPTAEGAAQLSGPMREIPPIRVSASIGTFTREASGTMMRVSGKVDRLLADDSDGSPHQRFIIRTEAGVTLLIAHNIALAPRLDGLATGDAVEAYGEYEWNDKGGLIHWTHKDPGGTHAAGYIEWRGRRFQ